MSTTINTDQSIGEQLERAVDKGNLAAVQAICESTGFDINATMIEAGSGRCTVLYYAVYFNKVPIARYLLTLQADVNVLHTTERSSPLHYAVRNNNSELVALLLQRGTERYLQDRDGYSPLAWAAGLGYREVGEYLVSSPVDALIAAKEEGAKLTATKELLRMYETTQAKYRGHVTKCIVKTEMGRIVQILLNNSHPKTSNSELQEASLSLLGHTMGKELESAVRNGDHAVITDICKREGIDVPEADDQEAVVPTVYRQPPVNTQEEQKQEQEENRTPQQPEVNRWFTVSSKSFILTTCIVLIVAMFMSCIPNSSISASLKTDEYNDKICSTMSSLHEFIEIVDFDQGVSVNLFYIDDRIEVRIKASTIDGSLEQSFYRTIYGWPTKQDWQTELMFCDKSVSSERVLCVKDKLKVILHKLYENAKIKKIAVYKAPLNPGSISTEEIAKFFWQFQRQWFSEDYHAFLIFCTNDERWWSLEKNSKGIHIVMNRNRESVVYEYDSEPRPPPIDLLVEDESNHDLAHLFSRLLGTRSSYNLIYSNCKDFCKLVFDKLAASTKSYEFTSPTEFLAIRLAIFLALLLLCIMVLYYIPFIGNICRKYKVVFVISLLAVFIVYIFYA